MKHQTKLIIGIFILLVGIGVVLFPKQGIFERRLCSDMICIRINNKDSFRQSELYVDSETVYRALFTSGTKKLRIEALRVQPVSGQNELSAAISQFNGLYEKAPAPYPGEISDKVICDPAFIPKQQSLGTPDGELTYFVAYLNSRLTYGSCTKDQAVNQGVIAFAYCPASSVLLRVELFSPTSEFQEKEFTSEITSLRCRN